MKKNHVYFNIVQLETYIYKIEIIACVGNKKLWVSPEGDIYDGLVAGRKWTESNGFKRIS